MPMFGISSKFIKGRLPATALFYALLITTLVGIVLTALLSLWMYFRASQQKDLGLWQQLSQLESGFLYASQQDGYFTGEQFTYSADTVLLSHYNWGVFEVASSSVPTSVGTPLHKTGLLGRKSGLGPSLELLDTRKQLALSGKSQIRGDAVLPRGGITTTTVNGRPFQGETALVGTSISGEGEAPALSIDPFDQLVPPRDLRIEMTETPDSLEVRFGEGPLFLNVKHIDLRNKYWKGAIFIQADSLIIVDKSSRLDGVILHAPKIQLDTSLTGRLQAFATEELTVGPGAVLTYPTVLAILPAAQNYRQNGRLRVDENVSVDGFILGLKHESARESQLLASFKNTRLKGRIVWQGGLEISGQVQGAVYCDNFFYRGQGGQFYFNYLVDCVIDGPARSDHWVEPVIWPKGEKRVVQWLD